MPTINLDKYPKIGQNNSLEGCIPVNIENVLKYYDELSFNEKNLLDFYKSQQIPLGFREGAPQLAKILHNFKVIFKGIDDFKHSIENVINHIRFHIDKGVPVLVSFKQIVRIPIFIRNNPNPIGFREGEAAHIRTAIGYNDSELCFFDPGDCRIKRYDYSTDEFANAIKGDYHTLVIKRVE